MQEKLDELDKKSLLIQFLSLVPGETFLLASDYSISSRILGVWCSMQRIDQKVEVRDTVIQKVLSTSVPARLGEVCATNLSVTCKYSTLTCYLVSVGIVISTSRL